MKKVKEQNVPVLRFPGFSGEWEEEKLGKISLQITSGSRGWAQFYTPTGDKFIRMTNLQRGGNIRLILDDLKYVTIPENSTEGARTFLQPGDILISITAELGKIGLITENLGKAYTNQHTALVRPKTDAIEPVFLAYFLANPSSNKRFNRLNDSGAKAGLNLGTIGSFLFSAPPLPEQQKIAAFLTAVDSKIEQLSKKKALLEQYKKGMMQKLFSQELRFKDEQGNDFPDWEVKKAGTVFHNHTNKKHNSDLSILAATQDRGVIPRKETGLDIKSSTQSISSYKIIEPGDFVISLRSFQGGIEFSEYLGICSPAYIVLKPVIEIIDKYFKFYFKKEDFISRLNNTVIGIRDGKQIPFSSFSAMKLNIPCLSEQRKIATFLSSIDKKINLISTELNHAQAFKKSLLQQMFV